MEDSPVKIDIHKASNHVEGITNSPKRKMSVHSLPETLTHSAQTPVKLTSSECLLIRDNTPVKSQSMIKMNIHYDKSCSTLVTLEEIAPDTKTLRDPPRQRSKPSIMEKLALQRELSQTGTGKENLPVNIRKYYQKIDEEIKTFEEVLTMGELGPSKETDSKKTQLAAKISFFTNVFLLIAKAVASYLSGSLSVISSLADSFVDLVSGIVIWFTSRRIRLTNFYEYPVGRSRLEPIGIVILSVIMAIASIQIIIQSVQAIVNDSADPEMTLPSILIIILTVVIKFALFMYCRLITSPSVQALANDHRNDVLSNAVALGFGLIGTHFWVYADPIGAILISIYIAWSWWIVGKEQIQGLSGHTAQPELLHKLLWVCVAHDDRIQYIDTLRAYHFGNDFIVEVHIVLDASMTLREAHDIGEPLQKKLEQFDSVERAFVHVDYEYEHRPENEHTFKLLHTSV